MPPAKKRPSQPRRSSPRDPGPPRRVRRSRFPVIALTIAIPLLAVLGFFAWRFARSAGQGVADQPAVVKKAPSLLDEFRQSGLEVERARRVGEALEVEVTSDPDAFARSLGERIEGTRIDRKGAAVVVRRPGEKASIVIRRFETTDSGAGLEEAEDEAESDRPAPSRRGPGEIVLILDDVGHENQPVDAASRIAAAINFAILPGTPRGEESARLLTSRGYELLCHLPMEPVGYPEVSPGEGAVLTSMNADEIRTATQAAFASVPGARGVNNHMGSKATADRRVMEDVLRALPEGAYFVDSRTSAHSIGMDVARELSIKSVTRDVFLDVDPSEGAVRKQLAELERMASTNGRAVGIGHMYPVTIRVLQDEIPRLQKKGIRFLRVSEAVH